MSRVNFRETEALPTGPGGALVPLAGIAFTPFIVNPDGSQGAQAIAYAGREGSTQASSLVSDSTGSISYWLNAGDYNIKVSDQQTPQRIQDYTLGFLVPIIAPNPTFIEDVGDGTSTRFVIAHDLGTQDVAVSVYQSAAPFDEVDVEVQHTDINTVTLIFTSPPSAGQFRVCIAAMAVV